MAPKSYDLSPLSGGGVIITIKSQLTKARLPPKGTSFAGQTVIVTGASSGLGAAAAEWFVELGVSRLILGVRSESRGEAEAQSLREKALSSKGSGSDNGQLIVDVWKLDMERYQSVQDFAARCATLDRLDIAILNAGTSVYGFHPSPEGHEMMMQVNYYSTVLLATLLLPVLKAKSPPGVPGRLSIVSSGTTTTAPLAHRHETPFLATFDSRDKFDLVSRYADSKAVAHPWMLRFAEKVNSDDVIVNLVDPGLTSGTGLFEKLPWIVRIVFGLFKAALARSARVGASTYIDAVTDKGPESHGSFLMDWTYYP